MLIRYLAVVIRFLLLFLLLRSFGLTAQSSVAQAVAQFSNDPELRGATVAIDVIKVSTGERVASYRPELSCIPASTQKLLTTAAAMDILGEGYRFTTQLLVTGKIEGGVLQGDVYLIGGGDPSLASPQLKGVPGLEALLDRWLKALTAAGIRRINGRIIADASYYATDGVAPGWPWSDIGNYYGAGAYGLNIHENFYFLDFLQRPKEGSRPLLQGARPQVPGLVLKNELRSGPRGSGDQAYIYGAPYNYENFVRGTIPVGTRRFTIKGALPDPPLFAAQALCRHLEAAGIPVSLAAESDRSLGTGRYEPGKVLDTYESPPLAQLIDRTNLRSINLYAEVLLREINKARGTVPYALSSTDVLLDWLSAQGLATETINLEDGSGLATRNFFSPEFMTSFLRAQEAEARWRASIPVAGRSGSMKGYLKGTAAEGRLAAKSGSLNGARAYAGYVTRRDGEELAFAIMVNNYRLSGRQLRNNMMQLMEALCTAALN